MSIGAAIAIAIVIQRNGSDHGRAIVAMDLRAERRCLRHAMAQSRVGRTSSRDTREHQAEQHDQQETTPRHGGEYRRLGTH
ncbi:MAG: hypothetical protein ABIT64_00940 [Lysobacteraceae bacterium]